MSDGAGRTGSVTARLFDAAVSVRCDDPGCAAEVADVLGDLVWSGPVDARWRVRGDLAAWELVEHDTVRADTVLARGAGPGRLRSAVAMALHTRSLASRDSTMVHAAAVERDGRAVLLVGVSGRGKSTLSAALTCHGYGYLSDEVAAVEGPPWSVVPSPKPVSLSETSLRLLGLAVPEPGVPRHLVRASTLGRLGTRATIVAVVALERGSPTRLAPASPADAMVALAVNGHRRDGLHGTGFRELEALARTVPAWTLCHDDVAAAVRLVDQVVGVSVG